MPQEILVLLRARTLLRSLEAVLGVTDLLIDHVVLDVLHLFGPPRERSEDLGDLSHDGRVVEHHRRRGGPAVGGAWLVAIEELKGLPTLRSELQVAIHLLLNGEAARGLDLMTVRVVRVVVSNVHGCREVRRACRVSAVDV